MLRIGVLFVPEIILAKEAVVLSLFDSDVDGSGSAPGFQEITDVNGLVRG